jgi:hypothetical protein
MRKPAAAGLVVALVVAGLGGFAVFEHVERAGLAGKSEQACAGRDEPAAGAPATLPLDLPLTEGEKVLDVATQGRTTVAFASEPGGRDDIVAVRDKVLADLAKAGYTVVGTDQEPGYEAEAELAGTHPGSLKVSPLCEGLLEVRYKIEL